MSELSPEDYQKQYDAALIELDAGAAPATPPQKEEVKPAPAEAEPAKTEPEAPKEEVAPPVDEAAAARERIAALEKQVADNKAWATKEAMRRAELERQWEDERRAASRPAILDERPELVEAIRYVANDPAPQRQAEQAHQTWMQTIEAVHPGIFAADADKELVDALVAKREASGEAWNDPLIAIRDISEAKLAFNERQTAKRVAAEYATKAAKSAMSVPAAGGGVARAPVDKDAEDVNRIKNMSDKDFEAERRKVLGY